MSGMPERIFADAGAYWQKNVSESKYQHEFTEYVRADLAAERIAELEDALRAIYRYGAEDSGFMSSEEWGKQWPAWKDLEEWEIAFEALAKIDAQEKG